MFIFNVPTVQYVIWLYFTKITAFRWITSIYSFDFSCDFEMSKQDWNAMYMYVYYVPINLSHVRCVEKQGSSRVSHHPKQTIPTLSKALPLKCTWKVPNWPFAITGQTWSYGPKSAMLDGRGMRQLPKQSDCREHSSLTTLCFGSVPVRRRFFVLEVVAFFFLPSSMADFVPWCDQLLQKANWAFSMCIWVAMLYICHVHFSLPSSPPFTGPNSQRLANPRWRLNTITRPLQKTPALNTYRLESLGRISKFVPTE